jgi:hypothetical protein
MARWLQRPAPQAPNDAPRVAVKRNPPIGIRLFVKEIERTRQFRNQILIRLVQGLPDAT